MDELRGNQRKVYLSIFIRDNSDIGTSCPCVELFAVKQKCDEMLNIRFYKSEVDWTTSLRPIVPYENADVENGDMYFMCHYGAIMGIAWHKISGGYVVGTDALMVVVRGDWD